MDERKYGYLVWIISLLTAAAVFFCLGITAAPLFAPTFDTSTDYVLLPEKNAADDEILLEIGKVSLNSATAEELMTIPGIGEVMAQRIVEYRELVGPFADLEQLMDVRGVGEGRYRQWVVYLTLN